MTSFYLSSKLQRLTSSREKRVKLDLPEEELPVEVGDIDPVQIDHIDVFYSAHGEVLQELAAQTTCANDEHPAVLGKNLEQLVVSFEALGEPCTVSGEQSVQVVPLTNI